MPRVAGYQPSRVRTSPNLDHAFGHLDADRTAYHTNLELRAHHSDHVGTGCDRETPTGRLMRYRQTRTSLFHRGPLLVVPGDGRILCQVGHGAASESHACAFALPRAHDMTRYPFGLDERGLLLGTGIGFSGRTRNVFRSDWHGRGGGLLGRET